MVTVNLKQILNKGRCHSIFRDTLQTDLSCNILEDDKRWVEW